MVVNVGAAHRHLLRRATTVAIVFRHGVNAVVSTVVWVDPCLSQHWAGRILAVVLGCWALYRLLTRSSSALLCGIDYCLTLAVCVALPSLVCGTDFYLSNSAPVAIAGTAVISFAVSLPARVSFAMTVGIATVFAWAAAEVIGWPHLVAVFNLYYFAAQWIVSAAIRVMVLRVADVVDESRSRRAAADIDQQVLCAVREYDREQLRLLHDTVASTLMMIGAGVPIPRDRLAARARRDLELIDQQTAPPPQLDVVELLRRNDAYVQTPLSYSGLDRLLLDGRVAEAVAAAAREVLNNIDRHAQAISVLLDVHPDYIVISDDGRGFDEDSTVRGHGIESSIFARMQSVGGVAHITSQPGGGTSVELRWGTTQDSHESVLDPDHFIARVRVSYGIALTVYAIANLAVMASSTFATTAHRGAQIALVFIAATSTLSAVPQILGRRRWPITPAVVALFVVAIVQPALLADAQLGTQANWAQATIGWCLLPLLLSAPPRRGATVLIACWLVPAVYFVVRDPSAHTVANIGYGTGSILGVQLAALMFNDLVARAADSAQLETATRARLLAAQRIGAALQAEYRNRYARLLDNLRPLLQCLSDCAPIDSATRRHVQNEYRNLRTLFDQAATFDHPLLARVRPLIDAAESRGLDVTLQLESKLPIVDDGMANEMAHTIGVALSAATTYARITLSGTPAGVEVSVLAGGVERRESLEKLAEIVDHHARLTVVDGMAWLTLEYNGEGGQDSDTARPRTAGSGHR